MKTDRREFIKYGLITSSVFFGSVYGINHFLKPNKKSYKFTGKLIDQSDRGHQLREAMKMKPARSETIPVIIVGGGMTGLLTGYYLKKNGFTDFKIMELTENAGGNSSYGENEISKYPWGAHYIPLPNKENKILIEFLKDMGLASIDKSGKIEFKDENLCQDPQERLFIKGEWQESILPAKNISAEDQEQLNRFHEIVHEYKYKKGYDNKYVFSIPVMDSSLDPEFLKLDEISFADFLKEKGLESEAVRWYLNYCTLDDYGMGIDTVSAWGGLHYFCSRRPLGSYDDHKILTWPEGNGWVLRKLEDYLKDHIVTNSAVMEIEPGDGPDNRPITCSVYNFTSKELVQYASNNLVFSAPQFLSPYLFKENLDLPDVNPDDYYSWLVANVTVHLDHKQFEALHWDNVKYKSASLGYVHARHQELRGQTDGRTVLTLYWPLYDKNFSATEVRKKIKGLGWKQWSQRVADEFEAMHPGISTSIKNIDIKIYGHAMIGPRVGRMKKVFRPLLEPPKIGQSIFFAHTDNSGMSLFEEAHYWGHRVARDVIRNG
jgi:hypothetical protein